MATMTFIEASRLALAEGDTGRAATSLGAAVGLRERTGSVTWPSMRQDEAALAKSLETTLGAAAFERSMTAGAQTTRREAIALLEGVSDEP